MVQRLMNPQVVPAIYKWFSFVFEGIQVEVQIGVLIGVQVLYRLHTMKFIT